MSEASVDLPVAGPVKKTYLYAGLAAVALYVGYAYWKRSQAPAAAEFVDPELTDYSGGVQTGGSGSTTGGLAYQPEDPSDTDPDDMPPATNAAWTQRAVSYLSQINYDAQVVAAALGKYLARLPLVPAEADIVRTAEGSIGKPPVGEFQIIMVPNPPTPPPPPPPPPPAAPTHEVAPPGVNLYDWASSRGGFVRLFGLKKNDPAALNPAARDSMRWDGPAGSDLIPTFKIAYNVRLR